MTAEVAILNRQAVALAADSAMTVNNGYGPKIYNTVNKLFTLSKFNPVGVMVYSSADVMGVPVDTVVKSFRRKLGGKSFDTLHEYNVAFVDFLTKNEEFFSEEMRLAYCRSVIYYTLNLILREVFDELIRRFPGWKEPDKSDVSSVATEVLNRWHERLTNAADLPGVTARIRSKVKKAMSDIVSEYQSRFEAQFNVNKQQSTQIEELVLGVVLKTARNSVETGFVIAGFGERDIFPQLRSFEFESSLFGIHKIFEGPSADARNGAQIVPFAQTEMMETFVEGRAHSFDGFLDKFISEFFEVKKAEWTNLPNSDLVLEFIEDMNKDLRSEFQQKLKAFTHENHIQPLMNTVGPLPKEELAIMAESLINLTAIKRRVSPNAETVGGPTDVAVISKGDGFVWIKRKHYFDATINPQFGYNYNREGKRHEDDQHDR